MVGHTWCLLALCFLFAPLGSAKVTEVADKASFLAALESGAEVIVVTQSLDLICPPSKDLAEKGCIAAVDVKASTRAIVVRVLLALSAKRALVLVSSCGRLCAL
jgi:hypothetical protein